MILAGGAFAILLVLAIPLFGFAREVAFKGRELVARVDQSTLSLSEYAQILGLRSYLLETQSENLQRLAAQAGGQLQSTLQALERARTTLPNDVVSDWVSEQLVRQEASRQGLAITPGEITDSVRREFDPPPAEGEEPKQLSEEEFQSKYRDFLKRAGTNDALYRRLKEFTMLAQKLEGRLQEEILTSGPQVHLQGILASTEEDAKGILARLDKGEDFAQVARETTLDAKSKESGGDLGWLPRGVLDKDVEDAAFSLKDGQVSGPVEADQGTYIIKLLGREDSRDIESDSLEKLKAGVLERWLASAQEKARVERYLTSDKITWAEKQNGRR